MPTPMTDTEILDWIEENRPQICKIRESECSGDAVEIDTKDGTWRGKTLRKAIISALRSQKTKKATG